MKITKKMINEAIESNERVDIINPDSYEKLIISIRDQIFKGGFEDLTKKEIKEYFYNKYWKKVI